MESCIQGRVLFAFSTQMQMLTALHLVNYFQLDADAVCLKDHLYNAKIYAKRLEELHVFKSVKLIDSTVPNEISLVGYTEVFATNKPFMDTYKNTFKSQNIQISTFDEGTLNYLTWYMEDIYSLCGCKTTYLYEPKFANFYKDNRFIIKELPKISYENKALLEQFNYLFNVDGTEMGASLEELQVFFSQPVKNKLSLEMKCIELCNRVKNFFTKKTKTLNFLQLQNVVIKEIQEKQPNLYRKFHPREKKRNKVVPILSMDYPWEVFLLNNPQIKVSQYSLFSSVLISNFSLGNTQTIKNYYLYPYFMKKIADGRIKGFIDEEVLTFFETLIKAERVIVIESMSDLEMVKDM